MFTKVRLHNFRSFDDVEIDFTDRRNRPKKMILLYGENGMGKTSIVNAFYFLTQSFQTMETRDILQDFLSRKPERMSKEDFLNILRHSLLTMEDLISENKMIGSGSPMSLEFDFELDNRRGMYLIETDNRKIVHERLEYTLVQRRGVYFDITSEKIQINSRIFKNEESLKTVRDSCRQFWGKHSLLAVIYYECKDKAEHYFKDQLSEEFLKVMTFLNRCSCKVNNNDEDSRRSLTIPEQLLGRLGEGNIKRNQVTKLEKTSELLTSFFHSAVPDIQSANYKTHAEKEGLHYHLYFHKKIAGKIREIPFEYESAGTQMLTDLLPYLFVPVFDGFCIIDELDNSLHDTLILYLLLSLYHGISDGQLIITTHNTAAMGKRTYQSSSDENKGNQGTEAKTDILPRDCIYTVSEDRTTGKKEIHPITYYDNRVNINTNIRNRYLDGDFGGLANQLDEQPLMDFKAYAKMII